MMLGTVILNSAFCHVPSVNRDVPFLHVVHITSIVSVTSPHLTSFLVEYHSTRLWYQQLKSLDRTTKHHALTQADITREGFYFSRSILAPVRPDLGDD